MGTKKSIIRRRWIVLKLTKKQEEMFYLLRLDGLRREIELREAEEAYQKAQEIEKAVGQYVIDNNEYFISDEHDYSDRGGPKPGDRITDEFDVYLMDESIFIDDYLPKVKAAYMDLYGIDNPLNFVYSEPMRDRAFKAERDYLMIAVDFLKICGRPEAVQIEKHVKGYLREDLKKRLMALNANFISGKELAGAV
jgi:hypothetical protein